MDAGDHPQSGEGQAQEQAQQVRVGQGLPIANKSGVQNRLVAARHGDGKARLVARRRQAEVIVQFHGQKGRDVERFLRGVAQRRLFPLRRPDHIGVALAKGVVDLIDHGAKRAVAFVNEPDADRVEDKTQDARHGQDRQAGFG